MNIFAYIYVYIQSVTSITILPYIKLHHTGIYRLFWSSAVDARSIRVNTQTREYYGYSRALQGQWLADFFFVHLTGPQFGLHDDVNVDLSTTTTTTSASSASSSSSSSSSSSTGTGSGSGSGSGSVTSCAYEERILRETVSALNRLRPR